MLASHHRFATPPRRSTAGLLASIAAMALAMAVAAVLRLDDLGNRPMHCDEAVQAIKFGQLLEHNRYVYDPREYHGPSLNYLTLPVARWASARRLVDVTEVQLRVVPAIFGILAVALVWLVRDELGLGATVAAAAMAATSPAMVFYSRYYIQEMLLVAFTFGAIVAWWRWARLAGSDRPPEAPARRGLVLRRAGWLAALGICLGLMHATKETCAIALLAMATASAATARVWRRLGAARLAWSILAALLIAAAVSALFFSSFFQHSQGVIDSYRTYFYYFGRAVGAGSAAGHVQPPHYYFQILFWWHGDGGMVWSETAIGALGLVGLAGALGGRGIAPRCRPWARFLGIYTLVTIAVYAVLPYKTPWCSLSFLHGMILLAGLGASALVRIAPGRTFKAIAAGLIVAAIGYLGWQAWRASFVAYEDPTNPHVYAHTTSDVRRLAGCLDQIARVHPDGHGMHIQVICPDDDYWPLPWYLRAFAHVGWFHAVPRGPAAPVVITQPSMRAPVLDYLYRRQPPGQRHLMQLFEKAEGQPWKLRPGVPLEVYVRYDLWQEYEARAGGVEGKKPFTNPARKLE